MPNLSVPQQVTIGGTLNANANTNTKAEVVVKEIPKVSIDSPTDMVAVLSFLITALIVVATTYLTIRTYQKTIDLQDRIAQNRDNAERDGRERERLEKLYETLVEIRMIYQGLLGDMINKVHHGTPGVVKAPSGIPPLIRLDMVIHMYFPSLNDAHKQFLQAKDRFGEAWGGNLTTSFANEPLAQKQKICGGYTMLFKELSDEISTLQQKLASMAKA